MKIFWAVALSAVSLFADVTGKWSGSFESTRDGETKQETAVLNLTQSGNKITGTAGPDEEKQMTIRAGSIEGDQGKAERPGRDHAEELQRTLFWNGAGGGAGFSAACD